MRFFFFPSNTFLRAAWTIGGLSTCTCCCVDDDDGDDGVKIHSEELGQGLGRGASGQISLSWGPMQMQQRLELCLANQAIHEVTCPNDSCVEGAART